MWPTADWDGFVASWQAACDADAVLTAYRGPWSACFAVEVDPDHHISFRFGPAQLPVQFTFVAPPDAWAKFLHPTPPRHYHVALSMLARVPDVALLGDRLAFAQHCHLLRRVLEVGKCLVLGHGMPAPASLRPSVATPSATPIGRFTQVPIAGRNHAVFYEQAGQGQDILCLHTAGADGRQFHRLMADPRLAGQYRLTAFDMPWHGRSPPPPGSISGTWKLKTDFYVETIMGFIAAAGLHNPIVLGASMSGEICLELAYRHPDAFRAIIACEACDHIQGRQTEFAWHPQVNQGLFVPEWIHGLMAPQSPAECAAEILWHYAQGGPGVFWGDIAFYSGEWDARDRVGGIDTKRCPLVMLTGEYDYSCTIEASQATAAKIPGARFRPMEGIGHFPFAENPALFATYLLDALAEI